MPSYYKMTSYEVEKQKVPLGLTLKMSDLCLAPELSSQEGLGAPQEASCMGSNPNVLSFWRGCLHGNKEGGVQGLRKPGSQRQPRGGRALQRGGLGKRGPSGLR